MAHGRGKKTNGYVKNYVARKAWIERKRAGRPRQQYVKQIAVVGAEPNATLTYTGLGWWIKVLDSEGNPA